MNAVRDLLDLQLGRVSMYRLVTLVLAVLALVSIGYTGVGDLGAGLFTVGGQLITLAVLLVVVTATSWALGRAVGAPAHLESSVITSLLLYFLFLPQTGGADLGWIALAGALAGLSKYLLAWRERHIFNPAAAGAFGSYLVQRLTGQETWFGASWWVASADLLPWVALGAFLVLHRTRRLGLGLVFVIFAGTLVVLGLTHFGQPVGAAVRTALETSPLIFFAGFMVSEPLTLPGRRYQQFVVAAVMAVGYAYPLVVLRLTENPPLFGIGDQWQVAALLIGNLVACAFARRSGIRLHLVSRRHLGGDTHEFRFRSSRPLRFEPGQYAELHVPHAKTDGRGSRRVFSIASVPGADTVSFGLRVPDRASSLKRTLAALERGASVRATGVGGDFVLPRDRRSPVALVAGGIGVTPFLSQLRHAPDRDAVLIYGLPTGAVVPFADELAQCRVVVVAPDEPASLPEAWSWVRADVVTPDTVASVVDDLADRRVYVSGPPAMVDAVAPGLRRRARSVHTDYFSGY
ncbi:hypothetical protein [Skermania piniformis]|uniref:FAD-binding FR-type domain-containing protein n=1 Tax=Skermania pinensis TaxID=39122 RepID=A0ABX8S917_9ACTN|nr:hypothetical protein [Skermania piniformis]QXQ14350.1 hypothetical protein KV203_02700 [Skermania piniformis]